LLTVLSFLLAALLQSTAVEVLPSGWPLPDLVALLALAWASLNGRLEGLKAAVVGGLAMDLLGSTPLGLSTLGLLPGTYLAGWLREQLAETNFVTSLSSILVGTIFVSLAQSAYLMFSGGAIGWQIVILRLMLPLAIVNSLLGAMLLPLLNRVVEASEREPSAFIRRTLPRGL
jgi:rod shape-determining protein MreD